MKSNSIALILGSITLVISGSVFAGNSLDERQANQRARITQGVKSGELTAKETAKLAKGQARLERAQRRAHADGQVTRRERARLHHKANVQSKKIYKNKHDKQSRPRANR